MGQITDACEGNCNDDVLVNSTICVVVPPGVVDAMLKQVTPVAEYWREGGLYLGEMTLSDFGRQGVEQ